jgi:two-component system phosphate regulon sensor histidine kinase PhoR
MRRSGRSVSIALTLPLLAALGAVAGGALCYLITGSQVLTLVASGLAAGAGVVLGVRPLTAALRAATGQVRAMAAGGRAVSASDGPFRELDEITRALAETLHTFDGLEKAAVEERQRLLAALDGGADGVVGINRDGNVAFANSAAERLFSRARNDVLGRPFTWLLPNAEVMEALKASQATGQRQVRSIERPNRQLLQVITAPITGGGEWVAMAVFHDFTDVRRAEQMRRDFVANVSHELRTPLASIRAVLETLEAGALSDPATARDFIARAETEVDRLTHMVAELLELSRIESGDMPAASEPVDIGVAVEEAVERLRSQALRAEVRLLAEVEAGLSPVTGDAERIERAVMNLVQNALKFTPAGGEVRVTAREESGEVRIEVADNGSGIDERDLPRIFERFYKADNSRRTVGSGLGLALVKHTAEAHGGKVSVESEMGRGSKFTISLPAAGRIPSKALAGTRGAE